MTPEWKQTVDRHGTVLLTAAAPADPAAELMRCRMLKAALDQVAGIVARTAADADADTLDVALTEIVGLALDAVDPEGAAA
jgi:hypothetical protein